MEKAKGSFEKLFLIQIVMWELVCPNMKAAKGFFLASVCQHFSFFIQLLIHIQRRFFKLKVQMHGPTKFVQAAV